MNGRAGKQAFSLWHLERKGRDNSVHEQRQGRVKMQGEDSYLQVNGRIEKSTQLAP